MFWAVWFERSNHGYTRPTISPTHSTIYGGVTCTCGRHKYNATSESLSTFRIIHRTAHFEKYHIPTSLPKLQPVSDTAWRKKAGSDQLANYINPEKLESQNCVNSRFGSPSHFMVIFLGYEEVTHLQVYLVALFYSTHLSRHVEELIISCDSCQKNNNLGKKYGHNPPQNETSLM